MGHRRLGILVCAAAVLLALAPLRSTHAQRLFPTVFPEARSIRVRDPSQMPPARIPSLPAPTTVSRTDPEQIQVELSLDEAIRIALLNARVIRVLAGNTAVATGQTIYSTAIVNTDIDQQNARFDPTVNVTNSWDRRETPRGVFDPLDPTRAAIAGLRTDAYAMNANVTKLNALGGTLAAAVLTNPTRLSPGPNPLSPTNASSAQLSYTQPLLQGFGLGANLAPIVVARIETERSYFQYKDTVQDEVRGVIEGYWSLVFARTDVWARRQQVKQLTEGVRNLEANVNVGFKNRADLAQATLALANTRASLVASEANVLQREAALRNILGLPPSDHTQIIPITPPSSERFDPNWDELVELAAERRPDVIELKLILEADQQLLVQARNNALPQLDGVALYRWNGLVGTMPNGAELRTPGGQFTDWTLGVNFSVPLGLRQSRAGLRRRELLIAQDRANLEQGLHSAAHTLATNVRAIAQAYEQYLVFKEAREAARVNLEFQVLRYRGGMPLAFGAQQVILINVLQAISDWGNAVSNEANALTQYNTELATLERETGTILETHGVVFSEEQYGSIGPLGRLAKPRAYPARLPPVPNEDRYGVADEPAENSFNLNLPPAWKDRPLRLPDERLPAPLPIPDTDPQSSQPYEPRTGRR